MKKTFSSHHDQCSLDKEVLIMSKTDPALLSLAAQALKSGSVEDQAKLLLLGMMNKSLRLPYAVVKPRQQESTTEKSVKEFSKPTPPSENRGTKRKECEAEINQGDRKEKRWVQQQNTLFTSFKRHSLGEK